MSQIASAYTVSSALLDRAGQLMSQGTREKFFEVLGTGNTEVLPDY